MPIWTARVPFRREFSGQNRDPPMAHLEVQDHFEHRACPACPAQALPAHETTSIYHHVAYRRSCGMRQRRTACGACRCRTRGRTAKHIQGGTRRYSIPPGYCCRKHHRGFRVRARWLPHSGGGRVRSDVSPGPVRRKHINSTSSQPEPAGRVNKFARHDKLQQAIRQLHRDTDECWADAAFPAPGRRVAHRTGQRGFYLTGYSRRRLRR